MSHNMEKKYIPGVCNIGTAEIKKRRYVGFIGLIATLILWMLFIWFDTPHIWRLTLFFTAMLSTTGFLQAYMHFCVYFGFASIFNFGEPGKFDSVEQAEFRAKDRKKAWQIIIISTLISATIATLGYLI